MVNLARNSKKWAGVAFLSLGLTLVSWGGLRWVDNSADAAMDVCATCAPISIPDPMHPWGGSFGRWVCVFDTGNAIECVEVSGGLNCVEYFPGECW